MSIEAFAGAGWGLASGLAVTVIVLILSLVALWRRTKGPETPPANEARADVKDFSGFGSSPRRERA